MSDLATAALLTAVLVVAARVAPERLRRAVPPAVLGGVVALVLRQFDVLPGTVIAWQDVGYHLFGMSFLAVGLTPTGAQGRSLGGGAAWMGVGQWVTFPLQAVVGGVFTLIALRVGSDLHPAFGFLAPMGLNEGPGQAVSIGRLWEAEGLVNAPSVGATMASLGFVVAYGVGLVAVRRAGRRRDAAPARTAATPERGQRAAGTGPDLDTPPQPATSHGRSAVVALLVAAGYLAVYWLVRWSTGALGPDIQDLALAVLFFVCLLVGIAVRVLLRRAGVDLDAAALRRVTVWAVDGLTVAILGSLAWDDVSGVVGPMLAVLGLAVAATGVAIWLMGRRLPTQRLERQLALFGTVTGTAASGLALIAMADPEMESTAATELGAAVVVSTPVVLGGIALTSLTATGTLSLAATTGTLLAIAVGAMLVQRTVIRRLVAAEGEQAAQTRTR